MESGARAESGPGRDKDVAARLVAAWLAGGREPRIGMGG